MIMLDNLPRDVGRHEAQPHTDRQRGNTMTFAVLRRTWRTSSSLVPVRARPPSDASHALVVMRTQQQQSGHRPPKRPRLQFQRTLGATCSKCKKPNHTAQQCGKTVNDQEDGTLQLATSSTRSRPTAARQRPSTEASFELLDDAYDSDQELHMTTASGCSNKDDSSALAITRTSDMEPPSRHWLVDCGASYSYCNDRSLLSHVRRCNTAVKLGNGQRLPVIAEGEVTLLLPPHGRKLTITARYVPELRRNLLSAGALGRQGVHVLCAGPRAHIYHAQSGHEIGQARCINEGAEFNLYRIDPLHDTSPLHTAALACQSNTDTEHDTVSLWHRRLGHSNDRRVRHLFAPGMTADGHALQTRIRPETPKVQPDRHCDTCAVCKHHAAPRPPSVPDESRAKRPLETVHIDLRGPHSPGIKQELYQLLIVDEYTHYAVGFTLKY